jgi:hypothetical protein
MVIHISVFKHSYKAGGAKTRGSSADRVLVIFIDADMLTA